MKKVLIITYYWPPAGGPGVQRWLKFVKYLPEFGIEPIVYIPENPYYPIEDQSLVSEVPENITIIRKPVNEPYILADLFSRKKTQAMSSGMLSEKKPSLLSKLFLFVRANFFIPDARKWWIKPSVSFLKHYIPHNNIDLLITTGPPHSMHMIGKKLKEEINVNWIADFRDPWTTIHYHKDLPLTARAQRRHKKLEHEVLNSADQILVTSPRTKSEFEIITSKPVKVITNGYEATGEIHPDLDEAFSISHIGSLLDERNPEVLWKVLSEIREEQPDFGRDLCIRLVGRVSENVVSSIKAHGLENNLDLVGYVSHSEAEGYQHNSQLLLLIEIDRPETRAIIPGKLFEYLRARRPIIAIGPKGSDVIGILKESKGGEYFLYSEKDRLKTKIMEAYQAYINSLLVSESIGIEKYERRNLTAALAEVIKSV